MTPCEELGYEVGDIFEIVGGTTLERGAIVKLAEDDDSDIPLFTLIAGESFEEDIVVLGGDYYEALNYVKPVQTSGTLRHTISPPSYAEEILLLVKDTGVDVEFKSEGDIIIYDHHLEDGIIMESLAAVVEYVTVKKGWLSLTI